MSKFIDKIRNISELECAKGCSLEQIKEAQEKLDLIFPDEYLEYVKTFGCIGFGAIEWTGLNIKGYLNTVTATEQEKSVNLKFPSKYFVLEDTNIDAKKIVVNEAGQVFMLQHDKRFLVCNSMSEYLDKCITMNK